MDRSRLDRLEHELALIAVDCLKGYSNDDGQVNQAFLDAGYALFKRECDWCMYSDYLNSAVLPEAERLMRVVRATDGALLQEPGQVEREIAVAAGKRIARVEEIEAEVTALSTRLEDAGYLPLEIGRALAKVGLTFASVGFISLKCQVIQDMREGAAERERAFLDECLGRDRYPEKKSRH